MSHHQLCTMIINESLLKNSIEYMYVLLAWKMMGDPVMNGSEGSLHLATCWIVGHGLQAQLKSSNSSSSFNVIVTHLLNKLCSQQQQLQAQREAGWGIKSFQRTKEPSY